MFKKIALGVSSIALAFSLSACGKEIDDTEELTIDENKVETVELERNDKFKANDTLTFDEKVAYLHSIENGLDYLKVYLEIGESESWKLQEIRERASEASAISYDIILTLEDRRDISTGQRKIALDHLVSFHRALYDFHTDVASMNIKNGEDYFLKAEETARLMNEYSSLYFKVIE